MQFKFSKHKTFIVAEISANHGQNFKRAISLIKKAKECGADAVKFQCYTPDTLTIDCKNRYFKIKHPKWGGQTLYQLYKKAYTPWKWFKKLKQIAEDLGLVFFATCYDKTSVDFLEELGVSLHKVSSFELVDLPLIEYVAKTKKPLILSTGMATLEEIKEAVKTARCNGAKEIVLLKCVSAYPAKYSEMNLKTIPDMIKRFKTVVGLSDHTLGTEVAVASVVLGAKVVEKHFALSRRQRTPDSFFSLQPQEFKKLVEGIRIVEKALGKVIYKPTSSEKKNRIFRRSLFVVKDIKKGDVFNEDNLKCIRPGYGLHPKYLKNILGKISGCDIKKGTPLRLKMIKKFINIRI